MEEKERSEASFVPQGIDKGKLSLLKALSKSIPEVRRENPYWVFEDGEIRHRKTGKKLELTDLPFIPAVALFFKKVYQRDQTEAQVVVVDKKDQDKLLPKTSYVEVAGYLVVILPQSNTLTNSMVSEEVWQKNIVDQGIVPVVRIHSHHIFDAYQSKTDFSSLNSGSLEIVLGNLLDHPQAAYWLDEKGKDTKKHVFTELLNL